MHAPEQEPACHSEHGDARHMGGLALATSDAGCPLRAGKNLDIERSFGQDEVDTSPRDSGGGSRARPGDDVPRSKRHHGDLDILW